MISKTVMATTVACLTLIQPAMAEKHLGAHVHGASEINLAQEGNQLYIELKLPAHDALGFEKIKTKDQQEKLASVLKILKSEDLWTLPAKAQCKMVEATASAGDEHEKHEHEKHEHEKHEHEKHEHEKHEHASEHKDDDKHIDIHATYLYTCNTPQQLNRISTHLFDRFQRSESATLQGITDKGAINATLNRNHPEATF
ncbi:hypothetical protein ACH42_04330 [Endozoicomonas sp. (ex Bugula neritina AB1)]|nr:hypothetical protein ACH42_04330 [Endozoicomonas sp. (ex Bugula neritina AB1)]